MRCVSKLIDLKIPKSKKVTKSVDLKEALAQPDDVVSVEDIFKDGGLLGEYLEGFMARPGQGELARNIYDTLNAKRFEVVTDGEESKTVSVVKHFISEAPTGTGKSLAYAFPAALRSLACGRPVIIATSTKALQDQLAKKDLPMVQQLFADLGEDLSFEILKGKSNYLCMEQYKRLEHKDSHHPALPVIRDWVRTTGTGERNELGAQAYRGDLWSRISISSDDCPGKKCPSVEDCFVYDARDRAAKANIVVVNYHLLFADVLSQGAILPEYDSIIFDEAHDLPDIAADFNDKTISARSLASPLVGVAEFVSDQDKKLFKQAIQQFLDILILQSKRGTILQEPVGKDAALGAILTGLMGTLTAAASNVQETFQAELLRARATACKKMANRVQEVAFGAINEEAEDGTRTGEFAFDTVYYFEQDITKVVLRSKVVEIAPFLRACFFEQLPTCMLSATITAGRSYEFYANRVGLDPDEYTVQQLESPFDPERTLAVVPEDFPPPGSREHDEAVRSVIVEAIQYETPGGVLALFTSRRALDAAYEKLCPVIDADIEIFHQDHASKQDIIDRFIEAYHDDRKALILATGSFWQGVDIPGQALSVLIIDKIPFATPDDPMIFHIDRKGGNAFYEYSMPMAIIALKQGVGRLIRKETDYGVVVVLDVRIITKGYGRTIKRAFPEGCFVSPDLGDVSHFLADLAGDDQ